MTLAERLQKRLCKIIDLDEGSSIFSDDDRAPGYFFDGKQVAHFFAPDVVAVRFTKACIRAERDRLKADPRIELRSGASDWLKIKLEHSRDIDFIVEIIETAVAAHRPPNGTTSRPPPQGSELKRRRRFH